MKLILIRFSYGLFLGIMQKTCTCTPIYFSVSWYDIPRCVPKHYFSINIIFLFPNCWSGAEMPCRMQKIESGLLTFTVFEMLRKTKKNTFTVDGEIRESANKWMNEWKACCSKGGRNFKTVCWHNRLDTCVTDVISLYPLYSLLLCSL